MDRWEAKAGRRDGRSRAQHKSQNWPMHGGSLRNPDIASKRRLSRAAQEKLRELSRQRKQP